MILRHWKLSSGLIAASMLTLAVSAAAQIVNVFDCEAGDMNYHIEVDLAAYLTAAVNVSVSEMMDPALAGDFSLDLVQLTPTPYYKAQHPKHGLVELKGRPDDGGDLYVDGQKITCTFDLKGLGDSESQGSVPNQKPDASKDPRPLSLGDNLPAKSYGGIFYDQPSNRKGGIRDTRAGEDVIIVADTHKRDRGYHWFKVVIDDTAGYMWGGDLCYADRYIEYMGERCVGYVPKPRRTVKETYGTKDREADWIAIAVDGKGRYGFGRSVDRFDAASNALRKCGSGCKVLERTTKKCIAYAAAANGDYAYGYSAWDDKGRAFDAAASKCRQNVDNPLCKVVETYCQ